MTFLQGSSVLITEATGSLGNALFAYLLRETSVRGVAVYSKE